MNQFGTTADFHLRQRAGGIGLRKLRRAAGHLGYKSAKIGGVGSLTEFPKSCTHEETLQKQAALYNWLAKTWKITLKVISHIHKVIRAQTYRFPHGYYTLYMPWWMLTTGEALLDCSSYCVGKMPGFPFAFSFLPDSVHGLIWYIQFLSKSKRGRLSALSLVSTSAAILKLLIQKAIMF